MTDTPAPSAKLKRWQSTTVAALVIGYAGYYFCRSNFSLAAPLLLEEFGGAGIDKEAIGMIASAGVFLYAIGKLFNGILCDFVGGRRMFIFGMLASIVFTIAFGLGVGFSTFVIAWSLNRLVQSMGWGALVKITSNWFRFDQYGTIMGILSLSFLFGDALARFVLGGLINFGLGWRGVFYASAAILGGIAVLNMIILKNSPNDIGEDEPISNPHNLYGKEGEKKRPEDLKALLMPYFRSFGFWMAAIMSLGLTLIRESFTFWTPTYLAEVGNLSAGDAGQYSLLFPLFGGLSVIAIGYLTDRFFKGIRGGVMVGALVPLVVVLAIMGMVGETPGIVIPLILVSIAAVLSIGPYSFIAGAIALDLGGKQGSSTAAGLFDGIGYLGGVLSGWGIGAVAERWGWEAVFISLAVVAAATVVATIFYWIYHERADVPELETVLSDNQ